MQKTLSFRTVVLLSDGLISAIHDFFLQTNTWADIKKSSRSRAAGDGYFLPHFLV